MDASEIPHEREIPELELALLRRGMHERTANRQACARCRRTPLIGERVYLPQDGVMLCELCRRHEVDAPADWTLVHGPEFGHTLRLLDRSAA
jgi:hypothetical protein